MVIFELIIIFLYLFSIIHTTTKKRLRNGQPFPTDNARLKVEAKKTVHILIIDDANFDDSAEFTLKAKNETGEATESFNLVVQSKHIFDLF